MLSGLFLFMLGGTATADRCQDLMAKWNNKVKEQHSMIRRELDRKFPNECARVRSKCTMWKRAAAMERERTATIDTLAAECREFRYTWGERKTVADMRRHNQSDLKRYEKDTAYYCDNQVKYYCKAPSPAPDISLAPSPADDPYKHCRDLNLARTYMIAAEAAVRVAMKESNYNNWSIAEDRFRDAARIFRCRGMTAEADAATAKADKVKRIYSSLPARSYNNRRARQKPPTAVAAAEQKQREESCRAAKRYYLKLKTQRLADSDALENLRNAMKKNGCN